MLYRLSELEIINKALQKAEGKITRAEAKKVHKDLPPGGVWRTIRGHHVYIVNGKVAAGSLPWVNKKGEVKAKKATKAHLKEYQAHIDKEAGKTNEEKPKKTTKKKTATKKATTKKTAEKVTEKPKKTAKTVAKTTTKTAAKTKKAAKATKTKQAEVKAETPKTATKQKVEKITATNAKKLMQGIVPPAHRDHVLEGLEHELVNKKVTFAARDLDYVYDREKNITGRLYKKADVDEAIKRYQNDAKWRKEIEQKVAKAAEEQYNKEKAKFDEGYKKRAEYRRKRDGWMIERDVEEEYKKRYGEPEKPPKKVSNDSDDWDDIFGDDGDDWDLNFDFSETPEEKKARELEQERKEKIRQEVMKKYQKLWDEEEAEYRARAGIKEPKAPPKRRTRTKKSLMLYVMV